MMRLLACVGVVFSMQAHGMDVLPDEQMSSVSGAGIAIALEDWRFSIEPTGYIEQTGSDWAAARPAGLSFRRGDLRWYGFTMSALDGVGAQTTWTEANCASAGFNGLGCSRGGGVSRFAAHDNPYVVRAFNYPGFNTNGVAITRTVLDVLAPSTAGAVPAITNAQDDYRFAFWGEIEVDRNNRFPGDAGAAIGAGQSNRLKSQTIIQGNAQNSVLRLFRVTDPAAGNTNVNNQTLGMLYHSYLKGDFRFSLAQAGVTSDAQGVAVVFHPNEGLHFRNVRAYVPLGQMFYQAMTLDSTRGPAPGYALVKDGNFTLELGRIPNVTNAYNDFYSLLAGDTTGYLTARNGLDGVNLTKPSARYYETHGYSRWGDWFPTCAGAGCVSSTGTRNTANATNDGIFFYALTAVPFFTYRWSRLDVTDFRARTNSPSVLADRNRLGMTRGAEGTSGNGTLGNFQRIDTTVAASTAINLGDARIEGMSINYLKLTSLGANQ